MECSLETIYPRLYTLSLDKEANIASMGVWDGLEWRWCFQWRREMFEWEKECFEDLTQKLRSVHLDPNNEDKVIWTWSNKGEFSTKSFTQAMWEKQHLQVNHAVKGVWRGLVPHRIEIFGWLAIMGKLKTREKLKTMGIVTEEDVVCDMQICH